MTAAEFLGRVRNVQAQQEDFDSVIAEFGEGCPCKNPPLKSKGKQHLSTMAHKKAFEQSDGQFFGMTVRQALEWSRSNSVVLVAGASVIAANENEGIDADCNGIVYEEDHDYYDHMDDVNAEGDEFEVISRQMQFDDDDVSDIHVHEPDD
jgi:hypothetical protein